MCCWITCTLTAEHLPPCIGCIVGAFLLGATYPILGTTEVDRPVMCKPFRDGFVRVTFNDDNNLVIAVETIAITGEIRVVPFPVNARHVNVLGDELEFLCERQDRVETFTAEGPSRFVAWPGDRAIFMCASPQAVVWRNVHQAWIDSVTVWQGEITSGCIVDRTLYMLTHNALDNNTNLVAFDLATRTSHLAFRLPQEPGGWRWASIWSNMFRTEDSLVILSGRREYRLRLADMELVGQRMLGERCVTTTFDGRHALSSYRIDSRTRRWAIQPLSLKSDD